MSEPAATTGEAGSRDPARGPDLAAIADKLEIIEVCTRVHWCYDHQEWDGLDDLFADVVAMPTLAQVAEPGFDARRYLDQYLFGRDELKRALSSVRDGLVTQHLIAGHLVTLDGDRAVCLAHSINAHLPAENEAGADGTDTDGTDTDRTGVDGAGASRSESGKGVVAHGNEYRFDLVRTADGWRVRGWVPRVRWSHGDEASYSAAARQASWREG